MATKRLVETDTDDTKSGKAQDKLLERALADFRIGIEHDDPQRKREDEDLAFDAGDQWPADILSSRNGFTDPQTGKKIPPRPTLTIPKLEGPVQQVINAARTANLAINIKPKGSGATKATADAINGLIRHIQVESRAQMARLWAYDRAVKCGRGYYRILKGYSNDGDFDLDLVIARILNQGNVLLDPAHIQPDASDMEWGFIFEDYSRARFKREFPKSKVWSPRGGRDFYTELSETLPSGWLTLDTDTRDVRSVRVGEYWYTEYEDKVLIQTKAGWLGFEDAEDRPGKKDPVIAERPIKDRKVRCCKLTPTEIIEERKWEGRYIPIVQVLGREYLVKGKRILKGMISSGKDAARSYNYMRSKQVEAVGLAPIAPYVMAEGQDEGYEEMWAQANLIPYAALKYKPMTLGGQAVAPPARVQASTDISAITLAAHAADDDIKSITGFSDPSLGRSNPADRSGRAITALQNRTDQGTSDYLENLTSVAMVHEGRILLDMLPHVYDRVGRVATVLDEDLQTSNAVVLNAPFLPGRDDDPPQQVPEGTLGAQTIDLKKGIYRVVVTVGKSFKTQREEAVAMLGEIISAAPQAASLVTDVLVENIDAPGFPRLAKRFKAMLPPAIQKMEAGTTPLPPEAMAQIQQLEGQLQQTQQVAQAMSQQLEQKQIEAQAKLKIEQLKIQSAHELKMADLAMKERLEMAKLETSLRETTIAAGAANERQQTKAIEQRISQEAQLHHDAISEETQRAHEIAQTQLEARLNQGGPQ